MDSYEETFHNLIKDVPLEELQELSKTAQIVAHAARDNSTFQAAKRTKLRIDCEIGRRAQSVAVSDFPPAVSHLPHSMNDSTITDSWDQMVRELTANFEDKIRASQREITNSEALKKTEPVNGSRPQPTAPYVCLTEYATGELMYCDFAADQPLMIRTIRAPNYHYTHIMTAHAEYSVKETADEVLLATGRGSFRPAPRWTAKIAR
jgi:hypothetical protein